MVAEAQRAPRVVHEQMTAFSTHPHVAIDNPRDALERALLRLGRIRAAYAAATDIVHEVSASTGVPRELGNAFDLLILADENMDDLDRQLEAIHRVTSTSVAA